MTAKDFDKLVDEFQDVVDDIEARERERLSRAKKRTEKLGPGI